MDTTKIKVGDKIRLRNGAIEVVTNVDLTGCDIYPVDVFWGSDELAYTQEGFYWHDHEPDDRDILEIIPAETSEETTDDIVVKPSHYTQYKIEPVTFVMENRLSFEIGNIVKYACRAGSKLYPGQDETQSRITDLEKVRRYAEMEINRLKGEGIL